MRLFVLICAVMIGLMGHPAPFAPEHLAVTTVKLLFLMPIALVFAMIDLHEWLCRR